MRAVAVIGPGRVGTAVAMGLTRAGYEVAAVGGRGEASLRAFTERLPDAAVLPAAEAARAGQLVVISVPDDQLTDVVRALARDDAVAENSRWIHVSGAAGLEPLRPAELAGAAIAACHPAQTFPDPETGLANLPGTTWAITAAEDALSWARVLVTDLQGVPVTVPADMRGLYHTGLALGANGTSTVVSLARDLLLGAGVDVPEQFLDPLVRTAASGGAHQGAAALTGPVRRGDADTVAAHLAELRTAMPEAVEAYVALARVTLGQARRAGLDSELADAVEAVLDEAAGTGREPS